MHQRGSAAARYGRTTKTFLSQYTRGDLNAALVARIKPLVVELLPGGHFERGGRECRAGSLAGEPGRSLVAEMYGEHAGHWIDHASGEHGDLIDLIAETQCGGDRAAACRWARLWLGLAPAAIPLRPRPVEAPTEERYWDTQRTLSLLWAPAQALAGTVAETYLRVARGLDLADWPAALRGRPAAFNFRANQEMPALVALVSAPDGTPAAVQVTWLLDDGSGKAAVKPARQSFGQVSRGAVRLVEARPGEPLNVTEGVEDALSIRSLLPSAVVWATLGTSGLRAVEIPADVRDVRIAGDNDPPGRMAAEALAERLASEGRDVRFVYPPHGEKDWNEAVRS